MENFNFFLNAHHRIVQQGLKRKETLAGGVKEDCMSIYIFHIQFTFIDELLFSG